MSILPLNERQGKYLIMATANGVIKKTKVGEFKNMRASGLIAIRMAQTDSLVSVHETSGNDHILLLTQKGKGIRFSEKNVRPMGRATSGVRGIKLDKGDQLIGMEVFPEKEDKLHDKRKKIFRDILTISENGIGKRTPLRLFPLQKRAGKGVKAATINARTGQMAAEAVVTQKIDQVVVTSKHGQVIKLPAKNIPQMGRATQGVILMRFTDKKDKVAAVAILEKQADLS